MPDVLLIKLKRTNMSPAHSARLKLELSNKESFFCCTKQEVSGQKLPEFTFLLRLDVVIISPSDRVGSERLKLNTDS